MTEVLITPKDGNRPAEELFPSRPTTLNIAIHVAVTTVALAALVAFTLAVSGNFNSHFLTHIFSSWKGIGGTLIFTVLAMGGGIVINKIVSDPKNGAFTGQPHWQSVCFDNASDPSGYGQAYLDTSELDEDGNGTAPVYVKKQPLENEVISLLTSITAPLHAACSIINYVGRLLYQPVKIATGSALKWEGYSFKQILPEMGRSLWGIIRAPFYAVALMMATLYAWVDPRNGLKLASKVELYRNNHISIQESFFPLPCINAITSCSGEDLKKNFHHWLENWKTHRAVYIAACYQPLAHPTVQQGRIDKITSTHPFIAKDTDFFLPTELTRQDSPGDSGGFEEILPLPLHQSHDDLRTGSTSGYDQGQPFLPSAPAFDQWTQQPESPPGED